MPFGDRIDGAVFHARDEMDTDFVLVGELPVILVGAVRVDDGPSVQAQ